MASKDERQVQGGVECGAAAAEVGGRWGGPAAAAGQGIRGAVVGWYLPVEVVDEKTEKTLSRAGVRVKVQMKRVAVRITPGGLSCPVGSRCVGSEAPYNPT